MWKLKPDQVTQMLAFIVATLMILGAIGLTYIFIDILRSPEESPPEAYQCPVNKPLDYGTHIVTFVVIDTGGNPIEGMLVDVGCDQLYRQYDVTQDDGSC